MGGRGRDSSSSAKKPRSQQTPNETLPEFEYDPNKSASNKEKHGIDFEAAQEIWKDPDRRIHFSRKEKSEYRYSVVGKAKGKIYKAIYTNSDERIRLISTRRANRKERREYDALRISGETTNNN